MTVNNADGQKADFSAVLFDFDGTLADTNELILESFTHAALTELDLKVEREAVIPHMGKPLREQWRQLTGLEEVDHLVTAYRQYNLAHHDRLVRAFPHVREVLEELSRRSIGLGVLTTKARMTTGMGLELLRLDKYFQTVITADDVDHPKPDPEPIRKALSALGADPGRTLMVGDSPADLQSAKRAGVRSAAVAWSLKGTEKLLAYNPDWVLQDMRDLLDLLPRE